MLYPPVKYQGIFLFQKELPKRLFMVGTSEENLWGGVHGGANDQILSR